MRKKAVTQQAHRGYRLNQSFQVDGWLLVPVLLLVASGLVMVGSSSIAIAESNGVSTYHYLVRHIMYVILGVFLASTFRVIPVAFLERISRPLMWVSALVLLLVFIPGIGRSVNGSARWISLGFVNFQVVEAVKIMVIIYMAGYLVRKADMVKIRFFDTLKPLLLAVMLTAILLVQPDMGSAAVITAIVGGMVWLAGAAWRHLFVLGALALPVFGYAAMEPYRLRRIVSFMNPWEDPFNSGFQLTQALIAVGRGEVFGVGLGASIQKLFYLPEAHTDFIFAVLAEEFGLLGVVFILTLFMLLVARIMIIGLMAHRAEKPFAGNVAYGIGLWIGLQALVSMGVNLGVLPTKGLTLPLISSGGSSVLMTFLALGIVFRIRYELDRDAPLKVTRIANKVKGQSMKRSGQGVLIMAGGTGGHIFPGLAVANVLKQKNIPVRWLGAEGGMEARAVPEAGIELDLVNIAGLRGKGVMRWIRMPLMLLRAVWQARKILDTNRPGCALSFGGYAAAPGGIAAWTKGIPVLVHEQNRIPGLTNRVLARFSRKILQGFPGTFPDERNPIDSGNPVREELAAIAEPQIRLADRSGPVRVLVTGGSQGAKILNETIPAAFGLLSNDSSFEIRHQAGAKRVDEASKAYASAGVNADIQPFIKDMADAYGWADLVICRSGALTVAELAAVGVASVLVPYAYAVDDHQTRNAEYLSAANAAIILPQNSLEPKQLASVLGPLLSDRGKLLDMANAARRMALPGAAQKVVEACSEWVQT